MRDPLETDTKVETRKAITGVLLVLVALALIVILRPSLLVTVSIIVGLLLTIMLHEFGHFIMAKRAGMKVTEFFIGFGPRIWSFRRGETEYGIKAIPAGGYVRIIGMSNLEEVEPEDEPRSYRASTTGKKLSVILAGVTVNLIIALVLFYAVSIGLGASPHSTTQVGYVYKGEPAAAAGLRNGDRILSIDGKDVSSQSALRSALQDKRGVPVDLLIDRNGQQIEKTVTPRTVDGATRIGVGLNSAYLQYNPITAPVGALVWMRDSVHETFDSFGRIFSPSGIQQYSTTVANPNSKQALPSDERPHTVVGIVAEGGSIVNGSVWALLLLLALINVFLALLNLIPLPPFDGGHAAVAIYEAIASRVTGRKVQVDYQKLMPVAAAVLLVFVVFGISALYLDIRGIAGG
jgi:membrane-associated protease RseP (regulator of RpoE activity)